MSALEQLMQSKPTLPQRSEVLHEATKGLFKPNSTEPTTDGFVIEQRLIGARIRARGQAMMLDAVKNGIPEGVSLSDFVHNDAFYAGLLSLQVSSDRGIGISKSRENEIRTAVARVMEKYPEGMANPLFVHEVSQLVKTGFYTGKLGDRSSPERKLLDQVILDILPAFNKTIKELSGDPQYQDAVSKLVAERDEILQLSEASKIPGLRVVTAAGPSIQHLNRMAQGLQSVEGPEAAQALQAVEATRDLMSSLTARGFRPGDNLEAKISQMKQALMVVDSLTENIGSLPVQESRGELAKVLQAIDQEMANVVNPQVAIDELAQGLVQRFDSLVKHADTLSKDNHTVTWWRGRMVHARDSLTETKERVVVKQKEDNANGLAAEMDYAELVASYLSLCRGPQLEGDTQPNVQIALGAFTHARDLLAIVDPESHAELDPGLQEYLNPLTTLRPGELEDAGFDIGTWVVEYSYEVDLDNWNGKAPNGQVEVDQRVVSFTVLDRLAELDGALASQFVEVTNKARSEGWDQTKLNAEYASLLGDAWGYVEHLRGKVIEACDETVERSMRNGIDSLSGLNAEERTAFAIYTEQQRREESSERQQYQEQRGKAWQSGFRSIPLSELIGHGVVTADISSLSDEQLAQRATELQSAMPAAQGMYDLLAQQFVNRSPDGSGAIGYTRLISILDAVPQAAVPQVQSDFAGITEVQKNAAGADVVVLTSNYNSQVALPLQRMTQTLGDLVWFEMKANPEQMGQFFGQYRQNNMEFENAELLIRRVERFAEKFSHLLQDSAETEAQNP